MEGLNRGQPGGVGAAGKTAAPGATPAAVPEVDLMGLHAASGLAAQVSLSLCQDLLQLC